MSDKYINTMTFSGDSYTVQQHTWKDTNIFFYQVYI